MFFGKSERPLFGVFHPAAKSTGAPGVVISGPIGHECIRVHRMCRTIAEHLGQNGFPTLRFDYTGNGDSFGESEDGNLEVWCGDLVTAVEELRDTSGCREVSILGIRIGATIAALVEEFPCPVDLMVLWDPVVDGGQFLKELAEKHTAWLTSPPGPGLPLEILGSKLSPDLLSQMERLAPGNLGISNGTKVILATSEDRPEYSTLEKKLRSSGVTLESLAVADEYDWHDPRKVETIVTAPNMLRALFERVTAG